MRSSNADGYSSIGDADELDGETVDDMESAYELLQEDAEYQIIQEDESPSRNANGFCPLASSVSAFPGLRSSAAFLFVPHVSQEAQVGFAQHTNFYSLTPPFFFFYVAVTASGR